LTLLDPPQKIFHATDPSTMSLALTCFQSLFATLYPDVPPAAVKEQAEAGGEGDDMVVDAPTEIKGVGVKVVANSLEELQEPDKSNAKPAVEILTALMRGSNRLAHYIISLTLSQLLSLYKNPDEVALRPSLLVHLSTILFSLSPSPSPPSPSTPPPLFIPSSKISHTNSQSPLEPFRDDLISVLTSATRSPTSRPAALEGLVNLIKIPGFLTSQEIAFGVSSINDVLTNPDNEEQYEAALDGLVEISKIHPGVIEGSTLPILFGKLPEEAPGSGTKENGEYRKALEGLAALCVHPELFEGLAGRVLERVEKLVGSSPGGEGERSTAALYAHHLLSTLRAVLKAKAGKGDMDVGECLETVVPRLFGMFVRPTLEEMEVEVVAKDERLLVDAGMVITVIAQRVDVGRQSTFCEALNGAFYQGILEPLLGTPVPSSSLPFRPLTDDSSTSQQDTVVLFTAAILAMRPSVSVTAADLAVFLRLFLVRSVQAKNETQLVATLHLLGQTVNKRAQDLEIFLNEDMPKYWEENVLNAAKPESTRKAALRAWAWVAKGLVVRSDQRGYEAVGKVVDFLHDPVLGREAAAVLGIIADESDRVISKENFAVIRLLYKQRFFTFLLPKIVAGYKAAEPANQGVFLVALSFLLLHLPKQIALTELPKLLPLLITALDLPDPTLRANVIDTLAILAKEVPGDMENSVSGIALKVLRDVVENANVKGAVKLRLAALSFLAILPEHIDYATLHPQKATILRQLGKAIDDPRRDVRRAAVECRSRWCVPSGLLAAMAVTVENGLGGSKGGASRLYVSCTIRPTLLLVVAVLSYANVVQGRSISLGRLDWIVWGPAVTILAAGAGLASLPRAGSVNVWIGLLVWLSVVTAIVSLCFGRLLVAILRVRASTQRHHANSPWALEQERVVKQSGSTYRAPTSFIPPIHSNFSGLSNSFCHTVGRSTSTIDHSTPPLTEAKAGEVILSFTSSNVPAVGYAPSRHSVDEEYDHRADFRSPTPGSTMGLLSARSNPYSDFSSPLSVPNSAYYQMPKGPGQEDHEIISFEEIPRPSFGSYGSGSTGGFIGGAAMRQAVTQEVWGDRSESPMPGSGSPKVELSQKEARGAVIRIGGHLLCSLFGYALAAPFVILQIVKPSSAPPLATSLLLVASVCQPGLILAIQTGMSESFFFTSDKPPVLTSSSAAALETANNGEMTERSVSRASSGQLGGRSLDLRPGISRTSVDCDGTPRGRIGKTHIFLFCKALPLPDLLSSPGRAMSMINTHPKLLILPTTTGNPESFGTSDSATPHSRLRSLTLLKTNRPRCGSAASRATVAGFEHQLASAVTEKNEVSMSSRSNELITRSLLATRRPSSFQGNGRVPFGFGNASKRASQSSPVATPTPAGSGEFGLLRTREVTLSSPLSPPIATSSPTDYTIDFLSSKLIPGLIPGTRVGKDTPVGSKDAPLPPRRAAEPISRTTGSLSSIAFSRPYASMASRNRNTRNLSLPGGMPTTWAKFSKSDDEREPASANEPWVEVDQTDDPIASITQVVRGKTTDKSLRRRSWKDRTARAWDAVEAEEAAVGSSTGVASRSPPQDGQDRKTKRRSALKLSSLRELETEVLDVERADFADVESSGEDAAQAELAAYQRATSPLPISSPATRTFGIRTKSPTLLRFAQDSVILRGSQVPDDDDDDEEVGVIQCATIRPISRNSNTSNSSYTSGYSLPLSHTGRGSLGSVKSFASSIDRSLTSQGFSNALDGNAWPNQGASYDMSSDDDESDEEQDFVPPQQTSGLRPLALRPLSLLAQRDINQVPSYASTSKVVVESDMKTSRRTSTGTLNGVIIPAPPIPSTVEEFSNEDKSSGTPTPKASRHQPSVAQAEEARRTMQKFLPNMTVPMSSTPSKSSPATPPAPYSPDAHITSRTRVRDLRRNASKAENPSSQTSTSKPRQWPPVDASGSAHPSIRAIR
ncbi:DNA repair/transcription protein MET18/MMS19, partial [Phenoliferia sp. Uapishka_3]